MKDKIILLSCIALLGVLLVGLPIGGISGRGYSSPDYKKSLENQLSDTLSQIEGVGENTVMITFAGEAAQAASAFSGEDVTEYPEIIGVLIVAQGAGDLDIRSQITIAASKALGIGANRISVLPRGSQKEGK
ncbi:MAG: hypothetical protein GX061_08350 [Eubacteriaceae bacterium]|nr:hypothetical protein [Eubacteriaceae bacterium]